MKSFPFALFLGMSLSAVACAQPTSGQTDEAAMSEAAQTGPASEIHAGPIATVSNDGLRAVRIFFIQAQQYFDHPSPTSSPTLEAWARITRPTTAHIERRADGSNVYYFAGDELENGSLVGSKQLVVEETWRGTPPRRAYHWYIGDGAVPAAATRFVGADEEAIQAVALFMASGLRQPDTAVAAELRQFDRPGFLDLASIDVQQISAEVTTMTLSSKWRNESGSDATVLGEIRLTLQTTRDATEERNITGLLSRIETTPL